MSIVEIIYEARCKHCSNKEVYWKGKLKRHKCKITGGNITLRDKACKEFKL